MTDQQEMIAEFWRWFQSHLVEFGQLVDTESPLWNEALGRLKQLDERLWFMMSQPDRNGREFIVTAEGDSGTFPLAERVIADAPRILGWKFVALKPPMGFDFTINYEGIEFYPRAMWFMPLKTASRPHDIGLRIGVPNLTASNKNQADNAVATILETALGERSASLDIQYLEVGALPQRPQAEGYVELHKLPSYIEWFNNKNRKA